MLRYNKVIFCASLKIIAMDIMLHMIHTKNAALDMEYPLCHQSIPTAMNGRQVKDVHTDMLSPVCFCNYCIHVLWGGGGGGKVLPSVPCTEASS